MHEVSWEDKNKTVLRWIWENLGAGKCPKGMACSSSIRGSLGAEIDVKLTIRKFQ